MENKAIIDAEGVPKHLAMVDTSGWDEGKVEQEVTVVVTSKYAWQLFGLQPKTVIITISGAGVRLDHITYKCVVGARAKGMATVVMMAKMVTLLGIRDDGHRDDFLWEAFGEQVKLGMQAEGMTMRALAVRVGCPVSSIHRLINGKGVSADTLLKVAYVFGVDTTLYLGAWLANERNRVR